MCEVCINFHFPRAAYLCDSGDLIQELKGTQKAFTKMKSSKVKQITDFITPLS